MFTGGHGGSRGQYGTRYRIVRKVYIYMMVCFFTPAVQLKRKQTCYMETEIFMLAFQTDYLPGFADAKILFSWEFPEFSRKLKRACVACCSKTNGLYLW